MRVNTDQTLDTGAAVSSHLWHNTLMVRVPGYLWCNYLHDSIFDTIYVHFLQHLSPQKFSSIFFYPEFPLAHSLHSLELSLFVIWVIISDLLLCTNNTSQLILGQILIFQNLHGPVKTKRENYFSDQRTNATTKAILGGLKKLLY